MKTEFILKPAYGDGLYLNIDSFQQSLPKGFIVTNKDKDVVVGIDSMKAEDAMCQFLINRELDRYYFLTNEKIRAVMIRKTVMAIHRASWSSLEDLPQNIKPQNWNDKLEQMLRLWWLAEDMDFIPTKLLLLFQIIELAYPDFGDAKNYPTYDNSADQPTELKECWIIRNLVAHSVLKKDSITKYYREYLGLSDDSTVRDIRQYILGSKEKHQLLEDKAREVIQQEMQSN